MLRSEGARSGGTAQVPHSSSGNNSGRSLEPSQLLAVQSLFSFRLATQALHLCQSQSQGFFRIHCTSGSHLRCGAIDEGRSVFSFF
jgi:hypothetical protein